MPAPIVAAAAKWAAKKAATKAAGSALNDPGGMRNVLIAAVAAVVAIVLFVGFTLVTILTSVVGGGSGAAAVEALQQQCDTYAGNETIESSAAIADIPAVALDAYHKAGATSGVDWPYIAAIGKVESDHGRFGGRSLSDEGDVQPTPIEGPMTDHGRAVGPMQFLSTTWKGQGKDGNYDGEIDAQNIYDAALAAGFYLKVEGAPADMDKAIFAYNHSQAYVAKVKEIAASYTGAVTAVTSPQIGGSLVVAHANIPTRSGLDGFNSSMARVVAQKPDIIGLNEMFIRTLPQAENAAPGYEAWRDPAPKGNDVGANETFDQIVMWKRDAYAFVDGARFKIVDDDRTIYSGGVRTWDRFATWVTLKRKSDGALLSFISTHHMTNPGKFGPNKPWRQDLYAKGMDNLLAQVAALSASGPVFMAGDMNVHDEQAGAAWSAPAKMRAAGYEWHNYSVDYIFYPKGAGVTKVNGWNGPMASDHNWLAARFNLGKPGVGGRGFLGARTVATSTVASTVATTVPTRTLSMTEDSEKDNGPGAGWTLPMKEGTFTYTARWGEVGSWSSYHTGLDFAAPTGTPVYAAADGTVTNRTDQGWAGPNLLVISHGTVDGQPVETWYAHMSQAVVKSGPVTAGQLIGYVGELGHAYGSHLHFEVHVGVGGYYDTDVDPFIWLASAGAPTGEVSGGDGCGPTGSSGIVGANGAWGGYENGKIPLDALCEADFQAGLLLECNATQALNALNEAYEKKFKRNLTPVGGYRDYAGQVQCQKEKGNLCAEPGTSNHGWGLAADFSNGGFQSFTTADYKWMLENASNFGWVAPDWARVNGSKPEPWHWEFGASSNPGGNTNFPTGVGTSIRIASWNMLGASHTEGPGCNKCDLPDSGLRMARAVEVIKGHDLHVIGMQEFQPKQQAMFKAKMPGWAVFSNADNAVVWDTAVFTRVSATTFTIPYFSGSSRQMPQVRLRHNATGKVIEVLSIHNPADVRGPAQQYRDAAVRTEGTRTTATANSGTPVFLTGDANDRERFFCQITSYGTLHSASGGSNGSGGCRVPSHMPVDWVMGSKAHIAFSGYRMDDSADVDYSSDHPIIVTTANIM